MRDQHHSTFMFISIQTFLHHSSPIHNFEAGPQPAYPDLGYEFAERVDQRSSTSVGCRPPETPLPSRTDTSGDRSQSTSRLHPYRPDICSSTLWSTKDTYNIDTR